MLRFTPDSAIGLALGVLAASATANAEVVGRYKYNGDNAWVYAVDGCNTKLTKC